MNLVQDGISTTAAMPVVTEKGIHKRMHRLTELETTYKDIRLTTRMAQQKQTKNLISEYAATSRTVETLILETDNTSGYKGVYLHQQEGKRQLKFTYLVSTIPWEFIHQKWRQHKHIT